MSNPDNYVVTVINMKTATQEEIDNAHYVGRPTPLGNPYSARQHGRIEAIALYKEWIQLQYLTGNMIVINELLKLASILHLDDKITLSCWCAPEPCHADIVALAIRTMVNRKEIQA